MGVRGNSFVMLATMLCVSVHALPLAKPCSGADSTNGPAGLSQEAVADKTIADCTEVIRLRPKDDEAYYSRGLAHESKGDFGKAIADYTEVIRLNPNRDGVYHARGTAHFHNGDFRLALADYEEAIRRNPKDGELYYNRGLANYALGASDKAIADLSEAIRLNPRDAHAYFNRGFVQEKRGNAAQAIADYSEVIRIDPTRAAAFDYRGDAYCEKGDLDKGIADFDQAVRLDPKMADAYCDRGRIYAKKGDYTRALNDLEEAIKLSPKHAHAYANRASVRYGMGELELAIVDFSRAIHLDPNFSGALGERGIVFRKKGDLEKALADLDAAVKLEPENAYFREVRGSVLIRRGDYEPGIADVKLAIQLDRNDPAAKFEAWPEKPLDQAAIQRGRQQVRQMLHDRPDMARFGDKAAFLCEWAARKFAGEDLGHEIRWNADEPEFDGECETRDDDEPRHIRIRRHYRAGPDKGKLRSFEEMWASTVFELYNITNEPGFRQADREAADGKLTREEFVIKILDYESLAAEKSRAFYIHLFLPWAQKQHVPTDPVSWFVGTRSGHGKGILLSNEFIERGEHEKYFERSYDLIVHGRPGSATLYNRADGGVDPEK